MHNINQSSPSDKTSNNKQKQAQTVATPLSKHYAAPKFHHSPAPASLPPPPFLSKSLPQRDASSFPTHVASYTESSPLGFLFSAKDREESLSRLRSESPPIMTYRHTPQPGAVISIDDLFSSAATKRSSTPTILEQPKPQPEPKPKPAWGAVQKPEALPLHEIAATTPKKGYHRKTQSSPVLETIMQPKRSSPEKKEPRANAGERPKSKGKVTPADVNKKTRKTKAPPAPVTITPKSILKRETPQEQTRTTTTQSPTSAPRPVRASAYTPLRPKATDSPRSFASFDSNEDDLRRQAVQLMDLLKVQPSSRDSSPHVKEDIENDLRRLLRLSA